MPAVRPLPTLLPVISLKLQSQLGPATCTPLCSAFQLRVATLGGDSSGSSGSDEEGPAAGTLPVDADDDNPFANFEQQAGAQGAKILRHRARLACHVTGVAPAATVTTTPRPSPSPPRCYRPNRPASQGSPLLTPHPPPHKHTHMHATPPCLRPAGPGGAGQGQEPCCQGVCAHVQPAARQRHGGGGGPQGACVCGVCGVGEGGVGWGWRWTPRWGGAFGGGGGGLPGAVAGV